MALNIIDDKTLQISNYYVKLLSLIDIVGDSKNPITCVYNVRLFKDNQEINDNICLKITRRDIDLDNKIVEIINNNDNFIKIYHIQNGNVLNQDFQNFKKGTNVNFMIMEKIDYIFNKFCADAELTNFHISTKLLNLLTYTLINTINYLFTYNLCYIDLKLLNIGMKIDNYNNIIIKIIDVDSIAYINANSYVNSSETTPFFYKNDSHTDFKELQLYVIIFTLFQALFNDKYYNSCKDYYNYNNQIIANYYLDPNVDYSMLCSNLKSIIITYVNKLFFDNNRLSYNEFIYKYGNNIIIEDINLNMFINNLFYVLYNFKRSTKTFIIDANLFRIDSPVNIYDDSLDLGNSNDIGTKIIVDMLNYINIRNVDKKIINTKNSINIKTYINPTIIDDITIHYLKKIDNNTYLVKFVNNMTNYKRDYYMKVENISNRNINFIKSKNYFNNIKFNIPLKSVNILGNNFNNVQLIVYKNLQSERKTYTTLNLIKIINSLIRIVNDLRQNNYLYNFDIDNIYIHNNQVQLLSYKNLSFYNDESFEDQLYNMYNVILNIITNNTRDYSPTEPNDELIVKLLSTNYFDEKLLYKINNVIIKDSFILFILKELFENINDGINIEINYENIKQKYEATVEIDQMLNDITDDFYKYYRQ